MLLDRNFDVEAALRHAAAVQYRPHTAVAVRDAASASRSAQRRSRQPVSVATDTERALITDAARILLLSAESELHAIATIIRHADVSDVAQDRVRDALDAIRVALQTQRAAAGLGRTA